MKKVATFIIVLVLVHYAWDYLGLGELPGLQGSNTSTVLEQAYDNRQSDIQVRGEGEVIKVLADDNDGSRHQRFILKLESGLTLLVAHNIDLAPRVPSLRAGDAVEFFGEYEWNAKGGVIHWTHHDPQGRHVGGWIKHQGRTYQ